MHKPTVATILAAVTAETGITHAQIIGGSHEREIVRARRLAIWLLKELRDMSLAQIGKAVGGQNNSTIVASLRSMKQRLQQEPDMQDIAARLSQRVSNHGTPAAQSMSDKEAALAALIQQIRLTTERLHRESGQLTDAAEALLPQAKRCG